jgi:hypothetical protein
VGGGGWGQCAWFAASRRSFQSDEQHCFLTW